MCNLRRSADEVELCAHLGPCGNGGENPRREAPLAAEVLAAEIAGESWALERDLVTALHPARFIVRGLKRGL